MELDDLFGQGRNQQRYRYGQQYSNDDDNYRPSQPHNQKYGNDDDDYSPSQPHNQKYGNDDDYRPSQLYNQQYESKLKIIKSMTNNPKIRLVLIIAAVVIIGIIVLIIIILFPLLVKILGYIRDNGIQGLFDTIWKGTK